ncbi:MAG: BatA domain-containing protein [Bacteroidia bacterium]
MKFANPQFLWALFSLVIPILIHLFHFRRFKTVFFTNVRFLREIKKETQSRSRLRQLLILLSRCLALAALVLAFAQPYIPNEFTGNQGEKVISIYIDNSFSMESQGESASLLELAKKHALEIAKSYKASDRFQLITNEMEGRQMNWLSIDQFSERLGEIKTGSAIRSLDKVIIKQQQNIKDSQKEGIIYLLSDFQRSTSLFTELKPDTSTSYNFIKLSAGINDNISVDSAWFDSPYREQNQADQLQFSVRNYSSKRFDNLPIKLSIDGIERGLESISAGGDSLLNSIVSFTTPSKGNHNGELRINDFPVSFDDVLYFSYQVPEKIRIMIINGSEESAFLSQLYAGKPLFDVENVSETGLDYSVLQNKNLIILNEPEKLSSGLILELKKYVNQGGSLILLPSLQSKSEDLNRLSSGIGGGIYKGKSEQKQKVGKLNQLNPIYDDVFERKQESLDLPDVLNYFPFNSSSRSAEDVLMTLQSGDLFMASYSEGKGKFYCSAVPLKDEASTLQKHAIFIPTFYKIALYSIPISRLYYELGDDNAIEIASLAQSGDVPVKIVSLDDKFEVIPEHRIVDGKMTIYSKSSTLEAGNYKIVQGDSVLGLVSFNYNRLESNPEVLSEAELQAKANEAGLSKFSLTDGSSNELPTEILLADQGKQLWKVFIILALIFLGIETILIRFRR